MQELTLTLPLKTFMSLEFDCIVISNSLARVLTPPKGCFNQKDIYLQLHIVQKNRYTTPALFHKFRPAEGGEGAENEEYIEPADNSPWADTDRDYTYEEVGVVIGLVTGCVGGSREHYFICSATVSG